jgi:S1-C subfamily serine protease
MVRIGNVLQYEPSPNSGDITYVYFDILSETTATPPTAIRAQSPLRKKDIPAIAKDVRGAVVSIIMSGKDGSPIAQGSGFLISKDGRILTNYHVIESGSSAIVKLPDGAFFAVDGLLAFDEARDVAIIKAHGEDFRTLTLGNSDQLQVGEEVVAIGNPLSLESTVSNGIISGIRTVEEEGGKFVQVTTPISPGSSGGPLFNMAGEVVGITTLYIKGGENLNFAIPINDAKRLLLSNSSEVQALPNEQIPTADPGPSLEATIDFMNRMVEPEKRNIALGGLIGTLLTSA